MSKPDIFMPLYVGDWLGDTMHLTTEEHGAYFLLVIAYWKRGGPLPDDAGELAAIARATKERWEGGPAPLFGDANGRSNGAATAVQRPLSAVVRAFFRVEGGFWRHKRVEEELAKAIRNIEQKTRAGLASAQARANGRSNGAATAVQRPFQRRGNPSPSPSPSCAEARAPGGAGGESGESNAPTVTLESTIAGFWPHYLAGSPTKFKELVAKFEALGATPATLKAAKAKADKVWTSPGGAEAILKNWLSLVPSPAPTEAQLAESRRLEQERKDRAAETLARQLDERHAQEGPPVTWREAIAKGKLK